MGRTRRSRGRGEAECESRARTRRVSAGRGREAWGWSRGRGCAADRRGVASERGAGLGGARAGSECSRRGRTERCRTVEARPRAETGAGLGEAVDNRCRDSRCQRRLNRPHSPGQLRVATRSVSRTGGVAGKMVVAVKRPHGLTARQKTPCCSCWGRRTSRAHRHCPSRGTDTRHRGGGA